MAKSPISDLKVAISSFYWEFKVTLNRDLPLGTLNMCTKFEKKILICF